MKKYYHEKNESELLDELTEIEVRQTLAEALYNMPHTSHQWKLIQWQKELREQTRYIPRHW